jgi:ADP-ribose pyrophosphatase YjhB (NUDIX family)
MPDPVSNETSSWRDRIRPIAIVVFRREEGCILAAPGFDSVKQQRFYRPLGGEIEFGETADDAARREILEEVGAEIGDLRLISVFENIFTFLGARGHEIVFAYEGEFVDSKYAKTDVVICDEGGSAFEAHWVPLDLFVRGEVPLYPDELLGALMAGAE